MRRVNKKPVHTVAMAPKRIAEAITTWISAPAPRFNGITTAAVSTHGANVIAVCRRRVLSAVCRSASVGVRPEETQRRVGATIRTAPTATVEVPTISSATDVHTFSPVTTRRPLSETMIATTSAAVVR